MEMIPCDADDRPKTDIVINEIAIVIDPFKDFLEKVKANGGVIPEEVKGKKDTRHEGPVRTQTEKELDERMTWSGRMLGAPKTTTGGGESGIKRRVVGKYL